MDSIWDHLTVPLNSSYYFFCVREWSESISSIQVQMYCLANIVEEYNQNKDQMSELCGFDSWDGSLRMISFWVWPFASCETKRWENAWHWLSVTVGKLFSSSQFSSSASHVDTHLLIVTVNPAPLQPPAVSTRLRKCCLPLQTIGWAELSLADLHGVKRCAPRTCSPVVLSQNFC